MKPLNVVFLVLAGALGGAVVMKVVERPKTPSAPVAQVQAPAPPAVPVEAPAPVAKPEVQPAAAPAVPEEEAKPSPAPPPKPVVKHHAARRPAPVANPEPVAVAQAEPPAPAQAAPAPAPQPEVAPQPEPPARVEPEVVSPPAPPPAPESPKVTLNAGMLIPVRLVDGLSSERNSTGDSFLGTLDQALVVDGFVIAERGARVEGRVVASDQGGKVRGVAGLAVELTRIRLSDGQTISVQTDSFEKHAEDTRKQDAAKIGVGAAIGAAIGAIAGGGKGAAIGAGVGGGAGAGDVLLTRGKPATLPSETRISFRLRAPVTVTERRG